MIFMCEKIQKKNVCVRGEKEKEKSCIILSNGNVLCVSSFLDSSLLLIFVSLFPLMLHQNKPIITSNNLLSTYFQLVVFFASFYLLCAGRFFKCINNVFYTVDYTTRVPFQLLFFYTRRNKQQ